MSMLVPILILGAFASLSPSTVIVFILVLGTLRARVNAIAFLIGWAISISLVFALSYELGGSGPLSNRGGRSGIDIAEIVLGVGLILLAAREWVRRQQPRKPSRVNQRLATGLSDLQPWQATIVGVIKQPWTLTAAAAVVVLHHHVAALKVLIAFFSFMILSTATVAILFYLFDRRPSQAKTYMESLEELMARAGPIVVAGIVLVVGVYLIIDGSVALASS
jgi:hypothetical protein